MKEYSEASLLPTFCAKVIPVGNVAYPIFLISNLFLVPNLCDQTDINFMNVI